MFMILSGRFAVNHYSKSINIVPHSRSILPDSVIIQQQSGLSTASTAFFRKKPPGKYQEKTNVHLKNE